MPSPMRRAAEKKLKKKPSMWSEVKSMWKSIGKRQGDRSGYRNASKQLRQLESERS